MKTLKFLKRMGNPALQYYDLVKIACYSSSPTVAYQSARALYGSKRLANSCRYLAMILRDRGFDVFQFAVRSSVNYPTELFSCYAGAWNFEQMLYPCQRGWMEDQAEEYTPLHECFHFSHYYEDYYDCPYCSCDEESQSDAEFEEGYENEGSCDWNEPEEGDCDEDEAPAPPEPESAGHDSSRHTWQGRDSDDDGGADEDESPEAPEECSTEDIYPPCCFAAIERIEAAIQAAAGTNYPVIILDDDNFNACANGSEVMLNQGLVDNCNEDELAFVIAHEVIHNARMHGKGNALLIRSYGEKARAVMRNGITLKRLIGAFAICFAGSLHFYKQKRDNERESDREAKRLMIEAGFNPRGAITLLQKFTDHKPGWFDTHPSSSERIENVKKAYSGRR
jgi:hypothetical protein